MIIKGVHNNFYGDYSIGKTTSVGSFNDIGGKVGNNCKIESFVSIPPGVEAGDSIFFASGVTFTNDKHPDLSNKDWKQEKTIVKDGAGFGANATILPGITIGKGAFVGAGAVVTKSVPPYETWLGNPARFYKSNCPKGYDSCIFCGKCL